MEKGLVDRRERIKECKIDHGCIVGILEDRGGVVTGKNYATEKGNKQCWKDSAGQLALMWRKINNLSGRWSFKRLLIGEQAQHDLNL